MHRETIRSTLHTSRVKKGIAGGVYLRSIFVVWTLNREDIGRVARASAPCLDHSTHAGGPFGGRTIRCDALVVSCEITISFSLGNGPIGVAPERWNGDESVRHGMSDSAHDRMIPVRQSVIDG